MPSTPQPGIFANDSRFFLALEYRCADAAALRVAIARIRGYSGGETALVLAFGAALWRSLSPHGMPARLRDFAAINGVDGFTAPSTQCDLLIWIHGPRADAVFDAGRAAHLALADCAMLQYEVPGFQYHDNRDLTGFLDGTANPQDDEAREAALIAKGGRGAGGSYVLSQKYVHDLAAFDRLAVADQEKVFGRSKADSTEMEKSVKPKDAHISRVEIEADGEELKIYRRSFPWGGVAEHGLYFLAFACHQRRFEAMLANMYGVSGDGLHDHLMHFTRALTGSFWFAPPVEELQKAAG